LVLLLLLAACWLVLLLDGVAAVWPSAGTSTFDIDHALLTFLVAASDVTISALLRTCISLAIPTRGVGAAAAR